MTKPTTKRTTQAEQKRQLLNAAYMMAVMAARDKERTPEQTQKALDLIREWVGEVVNKSGGCTNLLLLATAGYSLEDGIKELSPPWEQ